MTTEDQSTAACRAQPTPSDSASVDTAELRELLHNYRKNPNLDTTKEYAALIAHIVSLVAAREACVRKDAERLDQIEQRRVRLTPEYEGGFIAEVYGDDEVPQVKGEGKTARSAIDAAMAAHSPATSSKD